jgi:hypothetical protein
MAEFKECHLEWSWILIGTANKWIWNAAHSRWAAPNRPLDASQDPIGPAARRYGGVSSSLQTPRNRAKPCRMPTCNILVRNKPSRAAATRTRVATPGPPPPPLRNFNRSGGALGRGRRGTNRRSSRPSLKLLRRCPETEWATALPRPRAPPRYGLVIKIGALHLILEDFVKHRRC